MNNFTWIGFGTVLAMSAACRGKVNATDLTDTGDGNGGSSLGTLTINAMSVQAAKDTDYVSMEVDQVEAHISDPDVQSAVGAEWLVLSSDTQTVMLAEQTPTSQQIASGDAPESAYDNVRLTIGGGEYKTSDGDVYVLSPGNLVSGKLIVVTDYCVTGGAETVLDSSFNTTLTGDGGVSTGFDLDVGVDDGGSCSL